MLDSDTYSVGYVSTTEYIKNSALKNKSLRAAFKKNTYKLKPSTMEILQEWCRFGKAEPVELNGDFIQIDLLAIQMIRRVIII